MNVACNMGWRSDLMGPAFCVALEGQKGESRTLSCLLLLSLPLLPALSFGEPRGPP